MRKFALTFLTISAFTAPAAAGSLSVTVSGVVPNGSNVAVAVCTGGLEAQDCGRSLQKPAASSVLQFSFERLPPGRYAIAAFQDLKGTGAMERSKLGLPLEPYAFSNNAGRSRKPSFEAAAFSLGDENRELSLRLRGISHADRAQE